MDACRWNDYVLRSLLVVKGIFKEVFMSFLMVGHTYDNMDASFCGWCMKLYEEDFPTIPLLIKSCIDLDNVPVIPHMIEEIPNFKAFIKPYMLKGGERLVGHTKTQQFRFYMKDDGVPAMQFKLLCTTLNWARKKGIFVWRLFLPEDDAGQGHLIKRRKITFKPIASKAMLQDLMGDIVQFSHEVSEEVDNGRDPVAMHGGG